MEYVIGISIVLLYGVCMWGIVNTMRQLNK
jgi:hypothetical protein